MNKILFLDTFYSEVFQRLAPVASYADRQTQLARLCFGTSDFYSSAFRNMDWEAYDLVANDDLGLEFYARERGWTMLSRHQIVMKIILDGERPDILYCQDLSFLGPERVVQIRNSGIKVVGQISCPWPGDEAIKSFELLFTSFPHYLDEFARCGVAGIFLPIGFGSRVLNELPLVQRIFDTTFVGGISAHWTEGDKTLTHLASHPTCRFSWWGYGVENLPSDHPLRLAYRGLAWGLPMYAIYSKSRIVVNRHGEVARGFANNMRMFEATGCGALLITEEAPNLQDYFEPGVECETYKSKEELAEKVIHYLNHDAERAKIATAGYARTLNQHTYGHRLKKIEPILRPKA